MQWCVWYSCSIYGASAGLHAVDLVPVVGVYLNSVFAGLVHDPQAKTYSIFPDFGLLHRRHCADLFLYTMVLCPVVPKRQRGETRNVCSCWCQPELQEKHRPCEPRCLGKVWVHCHNAVHTGDVDVPYVLQLHSGILCPGTTAPSKIHGWPGRCRTGPQEQVCN